MTPSANRLQIRVREVPALPELGKDLTFASCRRVDADVEVHVSKRRRLTETHGRYDFREPNGPSRLGRRLRFMPLGALVLSLFSGVAASKWDAVRNTKSEGNIK